ncbi:hypothetical protein SDC9_134140 [bioreactor metagenome]|uniref:Uncharacterized protein n=1 Tax=bioreactor metagenome TaxID=1076179 RepID=A0A645DCU5_9ZZZZ
MVPAIEILGFKAKLIINMEQIKVINIDLFVSNKQISIIDIIIIKYNIILIIKLSL